jgi:GR25 family glycosyltransferase involved in LPS biosynthesis
LQKGLFDDAIDCTYVIHLLNNGRLEHVYNEIRRTIPTKTVVIAKNSGYKKCNKKLIDQAPYQDLTDAFLQCFSHAKNNGHKTIMIVEDDFIFRPDISQNDIDEVVHFINAKKEEEMIFNLGAIPIIMYPIGYNGIYKSPKTFGMQCCVYTEKTMGKMLEKIEVEDKHWDMIMDNKIQNHYIFYKPLCYQTFPETENKKTWSEKDGTPIIGQIKNAVIRGLNLHETPEPGFLVLYFLAKFLFLMIIILVIWIIWKIVKYTNQNKIMRRMKNKILPRQFYKYFAFFL